MSKIVPGPYKYDDDEDYVPTKRVKYSVKDDEVLTTKKQHTLDSDEEDNDDIEKDTKYDLLNDEDIDGQEDGTVDFEGETKITPFNMKEEMEEGHFDEDGFYHFKKEDQLKDAWLDNVDWVKVKHLGENDQTPDEGLNEEEDAETEQKNLMKVYEEIFPFLKAGETVAKALKRFGGKTKRLSSADRWKLKKQGKSVPSDGSDMDSFMKLTELANKVIETGNMDAYEETYEMINLKIQRSKKPKVPAVSNSRSSPSFDMFADAPTSTGSMPPPQSTVDNSTEKDTFDEVRWLFRRENKEESEVQGPFNTQRMLQFQQTNHFKGGVYVRKTTDAHGNWYNSSRIDFDIYT